MYLYVELWKPRDAWHALSDSERQEFVEGLGPGMAALLDSGIELVGFSVNDADTAYRADYTYLAAWTMPSKDKALELEQTVIDAGFHDYFEQINARGEIADPEEVLKHMAKG